MVLIIGLLKQHFHLFINIIQPVVYINKIFLEVIQINALVFLEGLFEFSVECNVSWDFILGAKGVPALGLRFFHLMICIIIYLVTVKQLKRSVICAYLKLIYQNC